MRQEQGRAQFRAVTRAAQHVWLTVAFIFLWLHFSYVQTYFRHQPWQLYTIYLLGVAGIAGRYLTGVRHGHERWHRVLFDGLSIVFIALGVNLTGGIRSDLWLVYFIFVIAETLAASARGFLITDTVAVASYVIATWPHGGGQVWEVPQAYLELLGTRIFFLVLVASIARTIAQDERLRQADLSGLREALSVSEERRRLARDLHDGIGHTLTRVILSLELARRQCAASPAVAAETCAQQADALRGAMEEMRQIVATLRTETTQFDLRNAVRSMAALLVEGDSLEVEVRFADGALPLSPLTQYHLSRVIQEALTNCMRHSGARKATVDVHVADSPVGRPRVVAEIADRGSGFDPERVRGRDGHGLRGMSERLLPYSGRVLIESAPGEGTKVVAEVPGDLDTWLGVEKRSDG